MDPTLIFTVIGIIISIIAYVYLIFAATWAYSQKTRAFGLASAVTTLLVLNAYSQLPRLHLSDLPLGAEILHLLLPIAISAVLSIVLYKQAAANKRLVDATFKQNLSKGVVTIIVIGIGFSLVSIIG